MEKSSKRGKIPPQDWPSIIARYQAGETLARIARTYDCSPPAISYIVSRSRAREAAAQAQSTAPSEEPQLVKGQHPGTASADARSVELNEIDSPPGEIAADDADQPDEARPKGVAPARTVIASPHRALQGEDLVAEPLIRPPPDAYPRDNGNLARSPAPTVAPPTSGERRILHLSLPGGDESTRRPDLRAPAGQGSGAASVGERAPRPASAASREADHGLRPGIGPFAPAGNGLPPRPAAEARPGNAAGAFIDRALRQRVDDDIAAFLAAFDAALDRDTVESRTGLREATDRLLRAGARTRIELERLEARVPLTPRESGGREARAVSRPELPRPPPLPTDRAPTARGE
jgi:hypothetical protein